MACCNLALALCFAFALQACHCTRILKAQALLDGTSYQKSEDEVVHFWLLGYDRWTAADGWHARDTIELNDHSHAIIFRHTKAWDYVNNIGSSSNVYWALHCVRHHNGNKETFYFDQEGSLRSSPRHPSQRTYQEFWDEAEPSIKKWYDVAAKAYFEEQKEGLEQGLGLDMDQMDLETTMVD